MAGKPKARRVVSITGSRADYGVMAPVHGAIAHDAALALDLVVTGMHLMPEFATGLEQVRRDAFGTLHELRLPTSAGDSGSAMAQSVGATLTQSAELLERLRPDIVLVHGDRGEMLAATVAAAHMNIALVHMSGGDRSGSIDDSVRNAISKLAHFHLTSCGESTGRLLGMGESRDRIVEVGDPAIDQLMAVQFESLETMARDLDLPAGRPYVVATLHPVSDEAGLAGEHMKVFLEALVASDVIAVCTYPNSDAGGRAMREVLESWRGRPFLRIAPNLGSRRYLSLMKHAAAVVGNSSSGIIESPSLKVPTVNVGSRQAGRVRAENVIDTALDAASVARAIRFALSDAGFRKAVAACRNPYGDGRAAPRTVDVLRRLRLGAALTAKWRGADGAFLDV